MIHEFPLHPSTFWLCKLPGYYARSKLVIAEVELFTKTRMDNRMNEFSADVAHAVGNLQQEIMSMNHRIITNDTLFQSDRKLFLEMITKTQSQIEKIREIQTTMFNRLQTDRNIQHNHYMNKMERLIS
jgi:hypothetical protein